MEINKEKETDLFEIIKAKLVRGEKIQHLEPPPIGKQSLEMWNKYMVGNAKLDDSSEIVDK